MAEEKKFKVKGMSCNHCAGSVKKVLSELEGVQDVIVNLEKEEANISYDKEKTGPDVFKRAVKEAGYELIK